MAAEIAGQQRVTLGADKGYDQKELVRGLREHRVTPHVAQKAHSAIDRRTTRQPGYAISQVKRKRVEEIFGWFKTVAGLRKTRHRGADRVGDPAFTTDTVTFTALVTSGGSPTTVGTVTFKENGTTLALGFKGGLFPRLPRADGAKLPSGCARAKRCAPTTRHLGRLSGRLLPQSGRDAALRLGANGDLLSLSERSLDPPAYHQPGGIALLGGAT